MPHYEFTLILRPLTKPGLVDAIARSARMILEEGGVIKQMHSLGHRDLPSTYISKIEKTKQYHGNFFLFDCHVPVTTMHSIAREVENDEDVLRFHFVNVRKETAKHLDPVECTLEEELLPPPYRKSVQELRQNQRIGRFGKVRAWKSAEAAWRMTPKSFTVDHVRTKHDD